MEIEKRYYSLRETEQQTGIPASTLRFWERRFSQLSPRKDGHGNRYYTKDDIALLLRIKYIRDELKITRLEAIQKELLTDSKQSDTRQRATDILLRLREELVAIRSLLNNNNR